VRAAQAGVHTVVIGPDRASRAIELEGASEAPRVQVTGPGRQSLDSPGGSGLATSGALRIIRQESTRLTAVGLQDPRPGRYRIEPLAGAAPPVKIGEAEDPRDARVSARVAGRGSRRVLAYDIRRRPGQVITFIEVSGSTSRAIGTVNGGGRGTLRFSPAPGTGRRRIEVQFELAGLPAERKTVARFAPPGARLARPARLRVRRRGTALRVTWARVPEAGAYRVVATPSGGAQKTIRTRARSVTVRAIAKSSSGRVSVQPVGRLREGPAASARFRATARRRTRFGPLPRCRGTTRFVCAGGSGRG
jgi:hypothetical protein